VSKSRRVGLPRTLWVSVDDPSSYPLHGPAFFRFLLAVGKLGCIAIWNATKKTESLWRQRIADWRASGQSMDEFAAGRDFALATLRDWSSRLKRGAAPRLVQPIVRPTRPGDPTDPGVRIEVAGARTRVVRGFDAFVLAEVVGALGRIVRR